MTPLAETSPKSADLFAAAGQRVLPHPLPVTGEARGELWNSFLVQDRAAMIDRERSLFDQLAGSRTDSLVLFGAGGLGRKTLAGLRRVGAEPLAFTDNNSTLWGTSIDGLAVLSPQDAANRFGRKAAFVTAVWSPGPERRLQHVRAGLEAMGCATVIPFTPLFWKFPEIFLPHARLDLPHRALDQADRLDRAFALWEDDASRSEYVEQLSWMLSTEFGPMPFFDPYNTYLPDGLFCSAPDEVFVDCGAFDGDTIRTFLRRRRSVFRRICAFEPDPANFRKLSAFVATLPETIQTRIDRLPLAAGARRQTVRFEASGSVASRIDEAGTVEVACAPLDEILVDQAPTFIKMDIEGAEPEALAGARNVICRHRPVLAVCVYHRQEHLWEIPLMLADLVEDYRFFLRRYGDEFGDVVCYAVPLERFGR